VLVAMSPDKFIHAPDNCIEYCKEIVGERGHIRSGPCGFGAMS
jgi:hypothetical protein